MTVSANPLTANFSNVVGLATGDVIVATMTVVPTPVATTNPDNGTSVFSGEVTTSSPATVSNTNASGTGSLAAAIDAAIMGGNSDIIFNIPPTEGMNFKVVNGAFIFTIGLSATTLLDPITTRVTIDGTSELQYLLGLKPELPPVAALVVIDGGDPGTDGLVLAPGSDGSTIEGLGITDFTDAGILVESNNDTIGGSGAGAGNSIWGNTNAGILIQPSTSAVSGNMVLGNSIGLVPPGEEATNSQAVGVLINDSTNNTVGMPIVTISTSMGGSISATTTSAANVIGMNTSAGVSITGSGATGNVVLGNEIGTDPTDDNLHNGIGVVIDGGASSNVIGGIATSVGSTIGGIASNTLMSAANVIGFNTMAGVSIGGSSGTTNNLVQGNDIGVDPANPKLQLDNTIGVIIADGPIQNEIGGVDTTTIVTGGGSVSNSVSSAGNVIGYNTSAGVSLAGSSNTAAGNWIGTDSAGDKLPNGKGVAISGLTNLLGGTNIWSSNTVSGTTSSTVSIAGNVVGFNSSSGILIEPTTSGSNSNNTLQGNFIGTNPAGNRLGNAIGLDIRGSSGNTIGGATTTSLPSTVGATITSAGNVVSANSGTGIVLENENQGNVVLGNTIGATTTAAGVTFFGNQGNGIEIDGGESDTIGGPLVLGAVTIGGTVTPINQLNPAASNLILGNAGDGIFISMDSISGSMAANTIQGNLISRNSANGVDVLGDLTGDQSLALISDNFIGTDPTGLTTYDSGGKPFGNLLSGVLLEEAAKGNSPTGSLVGATVTGNVISGNGLSGVTMQSGPETQYPLAEVEVSGNIIGLDALGANAVAYNTATGTTLPLGNVLDGLLINNVVGATVGGTSAASTLAGAGNVISGNLGRGIEIRGDLLATDLSALGSTGNTIQGNYVGTDITGTKAVAIPAGSPGIGYNLGNLSDGIFLFVPPDTQIQDNTISNNRAAGIHAAAQTSAGTGGTSGIVTIQGNRIGTDESGTKADDPSNPTISLGNGSDGVFLDNIISGATIGGTASSASNVISDNRANGIDLLDSNDVLVVRNMIGTDMTGMSTTTTFGNDSNGIYVNGSSDVTIGGTTGDEGNVISGNEASGVLISGPHAAAQFATPTTPSGPTGIATGPDGNLWFTETTADKIGTLDVTTGMVSEYAIPTAASSPTGIATGPNGNLWFTETRANQIGEITTTGAVTEFPIPTRNSGPTGIVAGPGGNLWFTEASANQIGEITTTGAVTEFRIPTANSGPTGIALGSDGNLWFTETRASQIGMINPATGVITEFRIPTANSSPTGIATGPDHNLWFTETGANQIGEINPVTHNFAEFAIPTASSSPTGIVAGSDGDLWFTESSANQIGAISPTTHDFREYAITTASSGASGIALGPDGNLWFTETSVSKIGQFNSFAASSNLVQRNDIGIGLNGSGPIPNHDSGVVLNDTASNTIGGTTASAGNVISGNLLYGVLLSSGASSNVIESNDIGTDANGIGSSILGNTADGVFLIGGNASIVNGTVTENRIVDNVISGNSSNGVQIFGPGSTANTVSTNVIGLGRDGKPASNQGNGVFLNDAGINNVIGPGNVISGNAESGVLIEGNNSGGGQNIVEGDFIGTDPTGQTAVGTGNGGDGVSIYGSSNNKIGGATGTPGTGLGNVISGNALAGVQIFGPTNNLPADQNVVAGNLIGINESGTAAIGNSSDGVEIYNGSDNTIGGTTSAERNVISGNAGNGVFIYEFPTLTARSNQVIGNLIGTSAAGLGAIPNSGNGVEIIDATNNSIGGITAGTIPGTNVPGSSSGAGNVISGNAQWGIQILVTGSSIPTGGNVNPATLANAVVGNYIGTGALGATAIPNMLGGVLVNDLSTQYFIPQTIGGSLAGAGNLISGNANVGIELLGPQITIANPSSIVGENSVVQGNLIGLGVGGAIFGNGTGVLIDNSPGNVIGGLASTPGTGPGNIISGNGDIGIHVFEPLSVGDQIEGNAIGTNISGDAFPGGTVEQSPPQSVGVLIDGASNDTVGGAALGAGNVLSANVVGVEISGLKQGNGQTSGSKNVVQGNLIGTDASGTLPVSNLDVGVFISNSQGNIVGPGNVISANGIAGVEILATGSKGNLVAGNTIGLGKYGGMFRTLTKKPDLISISPEMGVPVFTHAQLNGVVILGASSNTVGVSTNVTGSQANTIGGNVQVGVYITSRDFAGLNYPTAVNNVVSGNTIQRDGIYGVLFYDAPNNTIKPFTSQNRKLIKNKFSGNSINFRNFLMGFDIHTHLLTNGSKPKAPPQVHHATERVAHPQAAHKAAVAARPRVPLLFERKLTRLAHGPTAHHHSR